MWNEQKISFLFVELHEKSPPEWSSLQSTISNPISQQFHNKLPSTFSEKMSGEMERMDLCAVYVDAVH